MFDGVVACPDEQGVSSGAAWSIQYAEHALYTEFSMHEYPYCPAGPETYPTVIQDHAHTEHGYFQGKIVTTAVLGQAASTVRSATYPFLSHD